VVSREVYVRHACILRRLWVLSSFLQSEHETPLLVDFAARPPHVFVLVLFAHLLLKAAALDAQISIPASKTL
jgi:hypothetical protein